MVNIWIIYGLWLIVMYPLVMSNVAIENDHRNSGFSHEKWWIFQ